LWRERERVYAHLLRNCVFGERESLCTLVKKLRFWRERVYAHLLRNCVFGERVYAHLGNILTQWSFLHKFRSFVAQDGAVVVMCTLLRSYCSAGCKIPPFFIAAFTRTRLALVLHNNVNSRWFRHRPFKAYLGEGGGKL